MGEQTRELHRKLRQIGLDVGITPEGDGLLFACPQWGRDIAEIMLKVANLGPEEGREVRRAQLLGFAISEGARICPALPDAVLDPHAGRPPALPVSSAGQETRPKYSYFLSGLSALLMVGMYVVGTVMGLVMGLSVAK